MNKIRSMEKSVTVSETVLWESLGTRFDDFGSYREELRMKGLNFFEGKHLFKAYKSLV